MSIKKNSIYLLLSQIVVFVLSILVSIVVARILGPGNRGIYFLTITVNFMIVSFASCGICFTNTYLLSKRKQSLGEVNSASMIFALSIGLFFIVLYQLFGPYLHRNILADIDQGFILMAICLVPLSLYANYWESMLVGMGEFELLSKFNAATVAISAVGSILILLLFKWDLIGLMAWWMVSSLIITLIRIYLIKRRNGLCFSFNPKLMREMFSFGMKGHIGDIIWKLDTRLDMFIVNYFTGISGVGYYSLAVSLAEKIWFLPAPLRTAVVPIISGNCRKEAVDLTARANRHILFINGLIMLALLAFAPWGIVFFYGREYSPAVLPLMLLVPGIVFGRNVFSNYITGHLGKPQMATLLAFIASAIYLPMSFFMIKHYGINGAALTSSILYLLEYFMSFAYFRWETKTRFWDVLWMKRADFHDYKKLALQVINKKRQEVAGKISL